MFENYRENFRWDSVGAIVLNISASISIVMANKIIYESYAFKYGVVLTLLHFVVSFLGLLLAGKMGFYQIKSLPLLKVFPLALLFCGFVVLTNLSLQYNSVCFYQLAKIMTTPVIVLLNFLRKSETIQW